METLQLRKLYDPTAPNRGTGIVNGESSNVLNWDDLQFPWAYPMYKNMMANFWIPEEISMSEDKLQFKLLTPKQQFAFKRIIGLLAFLDSIQTDFSGKVSEYLTDSSISALMKILAFQEVVHNQSYSYALSTLVTKSEQDEIFEYWKHDPVLRERNDFVAEAYQEFSDNPTPQTLLRAIVLDVVLEGLYFYAGFAFFYNLARDQKMLGTSRIINYINKDEQIHVRLFTEIYKELVKQYPELDSPENRQFVVDTFREAAELEIKWGEYVIGDTFDNIDMNDLSSYIKFIANKRVGQFNIEERPFEGYRTNPLKWIVIFEDTNASKQDFFEGKSRQYAKPVDNGFDDL
jgi:ribonucleoside-diphosphate reductase beta chain